MIVFSHFCDNWNIGDQASGPYRYFDFGSAHVVSFGSPIPNCDVVIFGGGALGNGLGAMAAGARACVKIAWGVGMTRHGTTVSGPVPRNLDLYGSREWGQEGAVYAPCASCMSPLFDRDYRIERDAVLYLNADPGIRNRYPVNIGGLPICENDGALGDVLVFLGSGEVVVTNSYHGAFWAALLGRKVVLVRPYSSKFFAYKFAPVVADGDDWVSAARTARAYPEALGDARQATQAFAARVRSLIGQRRAA